MIFILAIIVAYIAGSLNFAIIIFKLLGKEDPRKNFSGNPGTTNVYRQAGLPWAIATLLLDVGRAVAIAYFSILLMQIEIVPWVGLALILGNRFPCFHHFKGGKGVANYLGFTVLITPIGAAISAIAWVITFAISRTPFISSFAMIITLGIATAIACSLKLEAIIAVIFTMLLLFYNHMKNITDLIKKMKGENV